MAYAWRRNDDLMVTKLSLALLLCSPSADALGDVPCGERLCEVTV